MLHCAQLAAEALTMRQSKHDHDPGQDGDEIVKTIRSRRGAMTIVAHVLGRWSERSEHHDSSYGDECVQGGGRTMLGGSAWLGLVLSLLVSLPSIPNTGGGIPSDPLPLVGLCAILSDHEPTFAAVKRCALP